MKAIVYNQYGRPEELRQQEIAKPVPANNELLIKVRASSINSWDWDLLTGEPKIYRLLSGIFRPKNKIIGIDVAGIVEAVGASVTAFKPGDEVVGDLSEASMGGFAEFTCARERDLVLKPVSLSFAQAAAVPQAAVLAYQGLYFKRALQSGEKVLINGAGGGVGTFAIQLGKIAGAEITAVDSAEKLNMMLELGADYVLDYKKTDFVKTDVKYDRIIDVTATRSVAAYKTSLNSNGILAVIGGKVPSLLKVGLAGFFKGENKTLGIVVHKPNKDLTLILSLIDAGKVKTVIDRCFNFEDIQEAFRFYGSGKHKGKIVILN